MKEADKQKKLDKLAQYIIENKVCAELASGATQLVFGDGNPNAEIVFIGEAPGQKEDEQGVPFVGAAGKFLNEMLETIGLERRDIYITNIVKYRPPNNRDPEPEEKEKFFPYLIKQLEIIQPKLIATLGRHSMNMFLPSLRISQVHGQPKRIMMRLGSWNMEDGIWKDSDKTHGSGGLEPDARKQRSTDQAVQGVQRESTGADDDAAGQELSRRGELGSSAGESVPVVVLPLYHPAAALYNGSMRQTLMEDFSKIPKVIQTIEDEININKKSESKVEQTRLL